MNVSKDGKKIIDESLNGTQLQEVIGMVMTWFEEEKVEQTEIQQTVMINHLDAMINRSVEKSNIPEVDASMFTEISEEALQLSERIVNHIGDLSIDEKYVLSIHFETAKNN